MTPIKFHVIPRKVVEDLTRQNPIPQEFLNNYFASRPGILDDDKCDIFCRNCRSETQKWESFNLFEQSSDPQVMVFPFWLELFEASECRSNIQICIKFLHDMYSQIPVVIQWNHDRDAATVPELQDLPENFFVLNFNTSKPTRNDILLPFWAINNDPPGQEVKPTYTAGFCGYGGTDLRRKLHFDVVSSAGMYWSEERVSEHDYFLRMANCAFSLCPRGGGLSSYRLYESIMARRPPVIFGDDAALPYPWLAWDHFSIRVPESEIGQYERGIPVWKSRLVNYEMLRLPCLGVRRYFSLWGVHREIHKRLSEFLK